MMRRLLTFLCFWSLPIVAGTPEIERYNHLKLSAEAQVVNATDNGELAAFHGYVFACENQSDHVPDETRAARKAFERFVTEWEAHPNPAPADRRRRLSLLAQAKTARSWRADYFDVMWGIWENRGNPTAAQPFMNRLVTLAQEGNPAALHGLLTWTNGMYADMPQRVIVLKAGIERGNPQILSSVGYNLGTHSLALRPMALQMLECAAKQGEAEAYNGIGQIAWQEGRWVDAYRAWERGANLGSEDCLARFDEIAETQTGHGPVGALLRALRDHYGSQPLFEISQLISLRQTAPDSLQLCFSDAQILALIKARIERFGLP